MPVRSAWEIYEHGAIDAPCIYDVMQMTEMIQIVTTMKCVLVRRLML